MAKPFAYRSIRMVQVYLVAPAPEFVECEHGPFTTYDEA